MLLQLRMRLPSLLLILSFTRGLTEPSLLTALLLTSSTLAPCAILHGDAGGALSVLTHTHTHLRARTGTWPVRIRDRFGASLVLPSLSLCPPFILLMMICVLFVLVLRMKAGHFSYVVRT